MAQHLEDATTVALIELAKEWVVREGTSADGADDKAKRFREVYRHLERTVININNDDGQLAGS
jgi:hypothetical protein